MQAAFAPAHVHSALLAVPFSDSFDDDVLAAVQHSGVAATARSLVLRAAAPQASTESADEGEEKGPEEKVMAAACLVERSGVAFACCAWLYIAVIEA